LKTSLFYKLAICLPYFVVGTFLLFTVLVTYGSSQKWTPPRLAVNLPVSPKINVYFWALTGCGKTLCHLWKSMSEVSPLTTRLYRNVIARERSDRSNLI